MSASDPVPDPYNFIKYFSRKKSWSHLPHKNVHKLKKVIFKASNRTIWDKKRNPKASKCLYELKSLFRFPAPELEPNEICTISYLFSLPGFF
jgi:hypothetical protein